MITPIRSVLVLGSGVMGGAIAAHVANAGLQVRLLDIVPKDARDRNEVASAAIARMKKHKPAPFSHPLHASAVGLGNLEDDLEAVRDADLVIEAIVERLDIKRALFERIDSLAADGTIIASNTSGLRIVDMLEGRSARFRQSFLVTHFFNPARYMNLLELVLGPDTSSEVVHRVRRFGEDVLGKGIVVAKDTPNFVANRIGAHAMMVAISEMVESGLTPEDIDAISGVPLARPKSATLRTADIVGLDTLAHVVENCFETLIRDEDRDVFCMPEFVTKMIEGGRLGDKTRGGFYRKGKAGIETLDPERLEYRPRGGNADIREQTKALAKIADPAERIRQTVATRGAVGEVAWKVLSRSLAYAANRVGEICDDLAAIDDGMRWGYNWELGPFQIWDALGLEETAARMEADGISLPESVTQMRRSGAPGFYSQGRVYDLTQGTYLERPRDEREVKLGELRRGSAPVLKSTGAEVWDVGDDVICLTLTTKANSLDPDSIALIERAVDEAEKNHRGLLLFNEGTNFCVGANLMFIVMAAKQKLFDQIADTVNAFQAVAMKIKYAQVPVVAAPFGMTLGGGLEICVAAASRQCALETYTGPTEVGVGLIPAGGGCVNLLWRALHRIPDGVNADNYAFVTEVFKNIAMAKVSTSAHEAQGLGYFDPADGVSFDRARQLFEAKQRLLGLARSGYHPPARRRFRLPGESGIATLEMLINTLVNGGYATEHDALIARKVATVLCGGKGGAAREVSESELLELEREAFLSLCGEAKSQDRMQHLLETGKPLRN